MDANNSGALSSDELTAGLRHQVQPFPGVKSVCPSDTAQMPLAVPILFQSPAVLADGVRLLAGRRHLTAPAFMKPHPTRHKQNVSMAYHTENLTLLALFQGYEVSEAEFERLVERMDLNADGCIAFDEFAAGLLDWEKVNTALPCFALTCTQRLTLTCT